MIKLYLNKIDIENSQKIIDGILYFNEDISTYFLEEGESYVEAESQEKIDTIMGIIKSLRRTDLQKAQAEKKAQIKQACTDYLAKYITKDADNAIQIDGVPHYFKLTKDDRIELRDWLIKFSAINEKPTRTWSGTFIKDENGNYIKQVRKEFTYAGIQHILNHYVARDESAYILRDAKIDELMELQTLEEVQAFDVNSIFN